MNDVVTDSPVKLGQQFIYNSNQYNIISNLYLLQYTNDDPGQHQCPNSI